jgi:hypothetical protein
VENTYKLWFFSGHHRSFAGVLELHLIGATIRESIAATEQRKESKRMPAGICPVICKKIQVDPYQASRTHSVERTCPFPAQSSSQIRDKTKGHEPGRRITGPVKIQQGQAMVNRKCDLQAGCSIPGEKTGIF